MKIFIEPIYSKKPLSLFELGCTIIESDRATIYLHPAFEKQEIFRGVSKQEVLDHELVHYHRRRFEGDRYEESLAFFRSKSRLRRYFGAAIRTPKEGKIFLMVTFFFWGLFLFFPFNLWIFLSYAFFGSFFFLRSALTYLKLKALVLFLDSTSDSNGFDALIQMDEKSIDDLLKSIR